MSENYQSNSHRTKEEAAEKQSTAARPEKKVEKVISGNVVQRKKGLGRKIAETFTGDDAKSVGNYVLFDVLIPASKAMISDAMSQGVERALFGDVRRRPNGGPRVGGTQYTSYNRMGHSSPGRAFESEGGRRQMSQKARATHDFDEVIIGTRGEAEEVIERMVDLINAYDVATVSDLYDLVGITGSFTDDKWGWYDLRDAHVTPVRGGYLLSFPKTSPIE